MSTATTTVKLYRYRITGDYKPYHQQSGSAHSNSLDGAGFSSFDDAEEGLRQALAGGKVISQTAIRADKS